MSMMWKFFISLAMLMTLGQTDASDSRLITQQEEGKVQYEIVSREARMPRYGDCYQRTLLELHQGCAQLTDEVQSRLALAFTNCYLVRFGWPVYPCEDEIRLEKCMETMDARAASVYSAMLTNTLAMCQFLQAQIWHQSTTDAVRSLTHASDAVSSQLSHAVDSAAALSEQLDSQLSESREALRSAFSEMRESTAEQRNLIIDVFDKVANLQALVMGEFTWFYSVVFYVSCVLVSLVATCTPRTLSARLPLLSILAVSLVIERAVTSFLLSDIHNEMVQEDLHTAVWRIRHTCVLLCGFQLCNAALTFRDPIAATAARLEELANATLEIKKLLHSAPERGIEMSTNCLASLAQVFDESASSDDTYNPTDESATEEWGFSPHLLIEDEEQRKYSLRMRPTAPVSLNPIVAVESPEAFERIVKRRETLTRRTSLSQQRQLLFLSQRGLHTDLESILSKERNGNISL